MRLICTSPLRSFRLLAAVAIWCVLLVLPSCKPNDNGGTNECRIQHISGLSGASTRTEYAFTYDDRSRLTSLISSGNDSIAHYYTYVGTNVILIQTRDSGNFVRDDSILLDANNHVINRRTFTLADGSAYLNSAFTYNGQGDLVQEIRTTSSATPPVIINYTTADGNITAASTGETYGYYEQAFRDGDFWQVMQLLEDGYPVFRNKNMLANIRKGSVFANINYTYDAGGKTNLLTYNENTNTFLLRFQHECF